MVCVRQNAAVTCIIRYYREGWRRWRARTHVGAFLAGARGGQTSQSSYMRPATTLITAREPNVKHNTNHPHRATHTGTQKTTATFSNAQTICMISGTRHSRPRIQVLSKLLPSSHDGTTVNYDHVTCPLNLIQPVLIVVRAKVVCETRALHHHNPSDLPQTATGPL